MNKKLLTYGSVVLGLVFIIIAIVYWSNKAGSLPTYFPGYEVGSVAIHFKHGLASLILAFGLFIFAWFKSAKKIY